MSASRRRGRCPRMGTRKKLRRKWVRLKASCVRTGLHSAGHLWSRHSSAQHPSSRSSSTSVSCSRRSRLPEVGRAVVITSMFWWEGEEKGQQSDLAALDENQTYYNGFHLSDSFWWWCCSQVYLYHHVLDYDASCSCLGCYKNINLISGHYGMRGRQLDRLRKREKKICLCSIWVFEQTFWKIPWGTVQSIFCHAALKKNCILLGMQFQIWTEDVNCLYLCQTLNLESKGRTQ